MKNKLTVHRGSILRAVASRHEKSIIKIANDAGYDQTSYYVHVKKDDLSFDILYKYSKAMNHDFSMEIPEMADYLAMHGLNKGPIQSLSYDDLIRDRDNWRDKYYALLEKHTELIQEKFNQK